jgi:hypothetical protein
VKDRSRNRKGREPDSATKKCWKKDKEELNSESNRRPKDRGSNKTDNPNQNQRLLKLLYQHGTDQRAPEENTTNTIQISLAYLVSNLSRPVDL